MFRRGGLRWLCQPPTGTPRLLRNRSCAAASREHLVAEGAVKPQADPRSRSSGERIGTQRYAISAAVDAARSLAAAGRQDSARRAVARARGLIPGGQGAELPAIEGIDTDALQAMQKLRAANCGG